MIYTPAPIPPSSASVRIAAVVKRNVGGLCLPPEDLIGLPGLH